MSDKVVNSIQSVLDQVKDTSVHSGHLHGHIITEAQVAVIERELAKLLVADTPPEFPNPVLLSFEELRSTLHGLLERESVAGQEELDTLAANIDGYRAELKRRRNL